MKFLLNFNKKSECVEYFKLFNCFKYSECSGCFKKKFLQKI